MKIIIYFTERNGCRKLEIEKRRIKTKVEWEMEWERMLSEKEESWYPDWNQYETNVDGNHWNFISKLDINNVEKTSKLISHPSEETKLKQTTPIILKVLVHDKTENLSERILDFLNW